MKTNENFVLPKTYFIGQTVLNHNAIDRYLEDTDQEEFAEDMREAYKESLSQGEILTSFYAKACYASLTNKKNKNISKTRSIGSNILGTIESGHGSVFEHVMLNFMIANCSRVYTHELVRHRVGTAFSQTSGRYVRTDVLKIVFDPILDPVKEEAEALRFLIEKSYETMEIKMNIHESCSDPEKNFEKKKKITSALRRFLPNGQSNEIGFSCNLRTLRQTIEARTSRHAEWEIRIIFNQIAELVKEQYKMIFADANYESVDGITEITFRNKKI